MPLLLVSVELVQVVAADHLHIGTGLGQTRGLFADVLEKPVDDQQHPHRAATLPTVQIPAPLYSRPLWRTEPHWPRACDDDAAHCLGWWSPGAARRACPAA